jgi:hypothetical protein
MIGAFGPWAWLNVKNPMDEDLIQDPFQNFVHGCDLYEHFEVLAIRSDIQKDDLSQPFLRPQKAYIIGLLLSSTIFYVFAAFVVLFSIGP